MRPYVSIKECVRQYYLTNPKDKSTGACREWVNQEYHKDFDSNRISTAKIEIKKKEPHLINGQSEQKVPVEVADVKAVESTLKAEVQKKDAYYVWMDDLVIIQDLVLRLGWERLNEVARLFDKEES